jgi:hypothetical protein
VNFKKNIPVASFTSILPTADFIYFVIKWLMKSIGKGKMMVEFFSALMLDSVCKYRS